MCEFLTLLLHLKKRVFLAKEKGLLGIDQFNIIINDDADQRQKLLDKRVGSNQSVQMS